MDDGQNPPALRPRTPPIQEVLTAFDSLIWRILPRPHTHTYSATDPKTVNKLGRLFEVMSNTDWTFRGSWPYEPKWFDTPDGRMHYVDEGPRDGKPVVMLHGNPTWGYLYRNFIPPLVEAGYRAIVPDHLGFGRSDKPNNRELYQIQNHCKRMELLLESLDLQRATVVPQDWGGMIGLYWATKHPQRVERLFIMNTYAQRPPEQLKLPFPLRLVRAPVIGELLVKGLHAFVRGAIFKGGVVKRDRITPELKKAYLAPHPSWSSRTPILVFPREIPTGPKGRVADLGGEVESGLEEHFRDKPVTICWALKDMAFKQEMVEELWLKTLPNAKVIKIEQAGHYLQEDAYEEIVPALLKFLSQP